MYIKTPFIGSAYIVVGHQKRKIYKNGTNKSRSNFERAMVR